MCKVSKLFVTGRLYSFTALGLFGVLSFFGPSQSPEEAVKIFSELFLAGNAESFQKIVLPDMLEGAEVRTEDVKNFLDRYKDRGLTLQEFRVDRRLTSEDGKTERFQATVLFQAPDLSREFSAPAVLEMILLWVLDKGKWWLERPISILYRVNGSAPYPTSEQSEVAMRFETAVNVLEKLGFPGKEDIPLAGSVTAGTATEDYKELERLYKQEKGPKGIDPRAMGVEVLLRGAARTDGAFLRTYHGDFPIGPDDKRRPVPWEVFSEYAQAAIKLAKIEEKNGQTNRARMIYRRTISLGRQILDEPGGCRFSSWGIVFQKMGATELARLPAGDGSPNKQTIDAFLNLCSRRLDLLRTATSCLDDMTDYRALKAAIIAAGRDGDSIFRPLGINTLTILGLKGAPAKPEIIQKAQGMVIINFTSMQNAALAALDAAAREPSGKVRSFIEFQKNWVQTHRVYGGIRTFN